MALPLEERKARREAQRLRGNTNTATTPEEEVIAQRKVEPEENAVPETTKAPKSRATRKFQYPLSGLETAPARISFSSYYIEPFFDLTEVRSTDDRNLAKQGEKEEEQKEYTSFVEDVQNAAKGLAEYVQSYKRTDKGVFQGSVTLPLQKNLSFTDGVSYNVAELGLIATAGELGNASLDNGRIGGAAKALGSQIAAKSGTLAASALAGAGLGKLVGSTGAGFLAGGVGGTSLADQAGAAAKAANRVSAAPNERTQFEKVNLRNFEFSFKMIARNRAENQQIKQIVRFFREEVYPEAILVGDAPLAYEFPNVFQIDIRNGKNGEPAPRIQRCYLESVVTNFNSTSVGLYDGEDFMEVDISLRFREITALDKGKIRKGY
jgi:hypothetical protein